MTLAEAVATLAVRDYARRDAWSKACSIRVSYNHGPKCIILRNVHGEDVRYMPDDEDNTANDWSIVPDQPVE
jgi:hypothetical protein